MIILSGPEMFRGNSNLAYSLCLMPGYTKLSIVYRLKVLCNQGTVLIIMFL